ncbi:hypothetical protein ON010_g9333 [Phytophthora cinnamomi]|nr:hypothetical protein ON010_g9333 [Phytophthora cinnamomi]
MGQQLSVVMIKNYGTYSRSQIEAFKRIENLKTNVSLGFAFNKWLLDDVLPAMPVHQHDVVRQAAVKLVCTYPYSPIPGLDSMLEYNYAMLYRTTPPAWLSDACIRALCERLQADFSSAFFGVTKQKLNIDERVAEAVRSAVLHDGNACVLILAELKPIFYYDPLGLNSYFMALKEIAESLLLRALNDKGFIALVLNNPTQFDQFSCGIFVSWSFIHYVVPDATTDMTAESLTRRRFELFFYILTGSRGTQRPPTRVRGA